MMRTHARVPLALLLTVVTVGGCGTPAVEQLETEAAVPVVVEPVETRTLEVALSVTGVVAPAPGAEWTIVAPAAARIAEITKGEGDAVQAGDVLVRFEIPSFTADLAARRADVAQATTRVATTRAAVTRLSGLFDRGVAAAREVDDAKRDQAEAEAALAQAESAVEAASAMLDRMVVRAAFAGVVARRWHNAGDLVDAASSDPVLRVIDPSRLQVIASVPVTDLVRVAVGQPARILGPASDTPQSARVTARPGQIEAGSATADVRLTLAGPTRLAAGSVVRVDIVTESRAGVLSARTAAVVHDGDDTYVMVAGTDNKAHKHAVELGLATVDRIEIRSGLAAGDLAIVRGQEGLPDDADVVVTK